MKIINISKIVFTFLTVLFFGMCVVQAESMTQIIYGNAQPNAGLVGKTSSGSTNGGANANSGQSGFGSYKSSGAEPTADLEYDLFADFCQLNEDAYHPEQFGIQPNGWVVRPDKFPNHPNVNATLLYNKKHDLAVIVFRGTEVKDFTQRDTRTDLAAFVIGMPTKCFDEAAGIVGAAHNTFANLIVTGHSLGGSEAAYAAAQHNVKALVFSSPGLPTAVYEEKLRADQRQWVENNVINVYLIGDIFAELGKNPTNYEHALDSRAHGIANLGAQQEGRCPAYFLPRNYPVENSEAGVGKHVGAPGKIIKSNLLPREARLQIDTFLETATSTSPGNDGLATQPDELLK